MARARIVHRCTECGGQAPRWVGRCPSCGQWNTLVEEGPPTMAGRSTAAPTELSALPEQAGGTRSTGVAELDRVLGGGIVAGSVTLVGGEPGIGKSTLLLQVLAEMARRGSRCLLVSAEESPEQVRPRAHRLGALVAELWVIGETSLASIEAVIDELRPDVVVVDSIQTVWDPETESTIGSVAQVRSCAHRLVGLAKSGGPAMFLVGHVTKDGGLAGPKVLEHVVDTVLSFEGDRHHALRLLRAVKHRFGPAGELGLFEMSEQGLQGVPEAGSLFLGDRRSCSPGSVVFPAMEGHRSLLVEIQALVVPTQAASPRRSASGLDGGRLALLLAVLDRRVGLSFSGHEVYVSTVGGVRVADPAVDLAVCLALASAATQRPVADDLVLLGEVGLGGEVRQVAHAARRMAEAARLGFARAVTPPAPPRVEGLRALPVTTLAEAVERFLGARASQPHLRLVGTPR